MMPAWRPVTPSSRRCEKYSSGEQLVQRFHVLHVGDARRGQQRRDHGPQIEHASGRNPLNARERLQHLVPNLVTAATDARTDGSGGRRRKTSDRLLDDPAGQRAPAAVQHRHLLTVRERDRIAVGHEHEQTDAGLAGQMAVHPLEVLVPRLRIRAVRRRPRPFLEVRAVHLPAHRHPFGLHPGLRGGAVAILGHPLGVVRGQDAEVERLVRPDAHSPLAGGEGHIRARQPHCACSRASEQRRLELLVTARDEPVELSVERLVERAPHGRALRNAGREQVCPRDLQGHRPQLGRPAEDRLRGRAQRQSERKRLGRLPAEQPTQLRRRVLALPQSRRDPRRHARGARGGVALLRGQVQVREPEVELLGRLLDQGGERRDAAVGPDRNGPQGGRRHQIGIRLELGVQRSVDLQIPHAPDRGGRVELAQKIHQLVPDPGARHGREGVARRGLASETLRLRVEREAQPHRIAHRPQETGGIVEEAAFVQHSHEASVHVGQAAGRVVEVTEVVAREAHRHGVDREVAPPEVVD